MEIATKRSNNNENTVLHCSKQKALVNGVGFYIFIFSLLNGKGHERNYEHLEKKPFN